VDVINVEEKRTASLQHVKDAQGQGISARSHHTISLSLSLSLCLSVSVCLSLLDSQCST
jgi:hypothetical protein